MFLDFTSLVGLLGLLARINLSEVMIILDLIRYKDPKLAIDRKFDINKGI